MMNDINYKAVDTRKIVDYLESCPGNIPVENIIRFPVQTGCGYILLYSNWNRAGLLK